ncbi:MAG: class I SAM-dependent methyltransferase, partial [Gammaproteobacteria bacterium]
MSPSPSTLTRWRRALGRLRRVYAERHRVDEWMLSGNYAFLKFAGPGHFYSPLPDLATVRATTAAAGGFDELAGIRCDVAAMLALTRTFAAHRVALPVPARAGAAPRFHPDNPYFSYGDAVIATCMLRTFTPARVIEVGSGFSSACMLDVAERYLDGRVAFTFIEPWPERLMQLLTPADRARCRIEQQPVQALPVSLFEALGSGDVLFIDSSHVGKFGSDVLHLLYHVLPRLAPGVLVHFHDVPWPFEYPRHWLEQGRAWNEAYLLRAFLQYNDAFEIVYFNAYMEQCQRAAYAAALPLAVQQP